MRAAVFAALLLGSLPGVVLAQPAPAAAIGWPEAVARLAAERTRAVACAARARTFDAARAEVLAQAYAAAKAETDAVVAGLVVALAQDGAPFALPDLERRLSIGFAAREDFCRQVIAQMPPAAAGERGGLVDTVGAVVGSLIEALVEIYKRSDDNDRLRRDTIRTQVEATRWPEFSAIPPAR